MSIMSNTTLFRPVPGGGQTITTTGTSAETSNAAPIGITCARLHATENAYIRADVSGGGATSSDMFLPSGATEYIAFPKSGSAAATAIHIHALQVTTGGTVYVHWMDEPS